VVVNRVSPVFFVNGRPFSPSFLSLEISFPFRDIHPLAGCSPFTFPYIISWPCLKEFSPCGEPNRFFFARQGLRVPEDESVPLFPSLKTFPLLSCRILPKSMVLAQQGPLVASLLERFLRFLEGWFSAFFLRATSDRRHTFFFFFRTPFVFFVDAVPPFLRRGALADYTGCPRWFPPWQSTFTSWGFFLPRTQFPFLATEVFILDSQSSFAGTCSPSGDFVPWIRAGAVTGMSWYFFSY